MIRLFVAIGVVALLSACVPDEEGATMSGEERATCSAEGGRIGIAGLSGGEFCILPTPDAGAACTTSLDCATVCEAATLTCEAEYNPFGCKDYINDAGERINICID